MVKITFKPTNEETFEIDFDLTKYKTVGQMKEAVSAKVGQPVGNIKFIFKGISFSHV